MVEAGDLAAHELSGKKPINLLLNYRSVSTKEGNKKGCEKRRRRSKSENHHLRIYGVLDYKKKGG